MRYVVLGMGISGKAAASYLLRQGHHVIGVDRKASALDLSELSGLVLSDENITFENVDQVIVSPGISLSHPLVQQAFAKNIEVIGEVEFAFRNIRNRCIGITGSNGKTTTTLQIAHVLKAAGLRARAVGNVGVSLSTVLGNVEDDEILVVELSSFQLDTLKQRCLDYAVILNITENHLDRYPSMREYAEAKIAIQDCLKENGTLFITEQVQNRYSFKRKFAFFDVFAICSKFGITRVVFDQALASFKKPPHRIEWIGEKDGVTFYNDSKSSNVESVIFAVRQMQNPVILIVGGTDKGSNYRPWIDCFKNTVKHVIAYGLAKEKIEHELEGSIPFTKVGPFAEAVEIACKMAQEKDIVLLSPGCSSYDQFANFERRGEVFKELIRKWIERKQFS
ncbi:MAG TPA: UDP-N-acetylmuramoyl-L-alanine--D-glutamate ligase [Chlamydiales bacterium]|nr:UDP-N-acetylmuramoyl-L-alanine--D-glutamate ligase [Chlamydiales bacterium]